MDCPNNTNMFIALSCTFFQVAKDSIMIYKGTDIFIDSYSSFFDNNKLRETKLRRELEKHLVTDVYICGIATDVRVGEFLKKKKNFEWDFFLSVCICLSSYHYHNELKNNIILLQINIICTSVIAHLLKKISSPYERQFFLKSYHSLSSGE